MESSDAVSSFSPRPAVIKILPRGTPGKNFVFPSTHREPNNPQNQQTAGGMIFNMCWLRHFADTFKKVPHGG